MALQMRKNGRRRIQKTFTLLRPADELYEYWRDVSHLATFMDHVKSVTVDGDRKTHWVVKAPAGQTVQWDAEIRDDEPNRRIAWRSLPGAQVKNAGEVQFRPAPDGRGTEVRVTLEYKPPAGTAGATLAKLFGEEPSQQLDEDLYRFKQLMETGRIPTTEGQPHGSA